MRLATTNEDTNSTDAKFALSRGNGREKVRSIDQKVFESLVGRLSNVDSPCFGEHSKDSPAWSERTTDALFPFQIFIRQKTSTHSEHNPIWWKGAVGLQMGINSSGRRRQHPREEDITPTTAGTRITK